MRWTETAIRYLNDAVRMNNWYETVASKIAPLLPPDGTVCDAGCGTGFLSLALSPYAKRVTAIDAEPLAVTSLAKRCLASGIDNIVPVIGDIDACPPKEPYDAMVFCYFGSTEDVLRLAKAQCRGRVFIIRRNYAAHRFTLKKTPRTGVTAADETAFFRSHRIPFTSETFTVEMGQPFRTIEDAVSFFRLYRRDGASEPLSAGEVQSALVPSDSPEFPLFYPCRRELVLICPDLRADRG